MKFKYSSSKMSRKKRIMLIVLLTFIIGALSPFLINAIVINSTSKYIVTKEEAASLNADCIIVLGALVWDNNRLSDMLEVWFFRRLSSLYHLV